MVHFCFVYVHMTLLSSYTLVSLIRYLVMSAPGEHERVWNQVSYSTLTKDLSSLSLHPQVAGTAF